MIKRLIEIKTKRKQHGEMEQGKVRLVDIAKRVNVSSALVSKVLNGHSGNIRVSPEKAEMIRNVAAELNYQPNINARALAGQATKVIGILLDSRAPQVFFRLLAEIEKEAAMHDYRTLIGEAHDNVENLFENYQTLRQHGVDGVICISHDYPGENEKLEKLFQNSRPIVFIGPPEVKGHSHVMLEINTGIRESVQYLQKNGRRKIAMIVTRNTKHHTIQERIRGYLDVLPKQKNLIFPMNASGDSAEEMRKEIKRIIKEFFLPKKIDAVLVPNDIIALTMLGEFAEAGIRVPQDIALIGHDNEFFSECCPLPITTIDENNTGVAACAVKMLLDMIQESPDVRSCHKITVKPRLIPRKTT